MRQHGVRRVLSKVAAPAALAVALALVVTSCAQQAESPVAPSAGKGGTLNVEPSPSPTATPTPTPTPTPTGAPCSPGFWKNHLDQFNQFCGAAAALPGDQFTTCEELLTALTCKGSDASCGRSAAAAAMNTVSACSE
jgi:hypothetical protein